MQFVVVILLEKTRFQDIKVYFCLKNAKKMERGQPGLTLDNIEKPLIHFASPRPRKPLNCLKKLSPSPKTIEVFGKPSPVPFPCDRGGDREGDPFIQCPLLSSLVCVDRSRRLIGTYLVEKQKKDYCVLSKSSLQIQNSKFMKNYNIYFL